MKIYLRIFALTLFVCLPFIAMADHRDRMLGDLDTIKHIFETAYAPSEWKNQQFGWELDVEIEHAKNRVKQSDACSVKQFQSLVKDFILSTKDYHCKVLFYSTEKATLPFRVHGANGKYYFAYIDGNKLNPEKFSFDVGDEIVEFNGVSISQAIEELQKKECGQNNSETDRAFAEFFLTTRVGRLGYDIPQGAVSFTVRKRGATALVKYDLEWEYAVERIRPSLIKMASLAAQMKTPFLKRQAYYQEKLLIPEYEVISSARLDDANPFELMGAINSYIPRMGKVVWEVESADSPFDAYIFETSDGETVGFIRIPAYDSDDPEADAEEFHKIMMYFQENTQAIVIDQLNNPGGLILYMYGLLSMVADQPLEVPKHCQMITQKDVMFAIEEKELFELLETQEEIESIFGASFFGLPTTLELKESLVNYSDFIIDQWNAGHIFTEFGYKFGIEKIKPHRHGSYTKPILLLVNSLDLSGGDFFPAILQDNHRATILGTRTGGAGGQVAKVTFPSLNGIDQIFYTTSLAERPNGKIIENNGVTPDVIYEFSEVDMENQYAEYINKILETLKNLLPRYGTVQE